MGIGSTMRYEIDGSVECGWIFDEVSPDPDTRYVHPSKSLFMKTSPQKQVNYLFRTIKKSSDIIVSDLTSVHYVVINGWMKNRTPSSSRVFVFSLVFEIYASFRFFSFYGFKEIFSRISNSLCL